MSFTLDEMAASMKVPAPPLRDNSISAWSVWANKMYSIGPEDEAEEDQETGKAYATIEKIIERCKNKCAGQNAIQASIAKKMRRASRAETISSSPHTDLLPAAAAPPPVDGISHSAIATSGPDIDVDIDAEPLPAGIDTSDTWEPDVYQIPADVMRQNMACYIFRLTDAAEDWKKWYEVGCNYASVPSVAIHSSLPQGMWPKVAML